MKTPFIFYILFSALTAALLSSCKKGERQLVKAPAIDQVDSSAVFEKELKENKTRGILTKPTNISNYIEAKFEFESTIEVVDFHTGFDKNSLPEFVALPGKLGTINFKGKMEKDGKTFYFNLMGRLNKEGTYESSPEGITNIDLEWANSNVSIYEGDERISEYLVYQSHPEESGMEIHNNGKTILRLQEFSKNHVKGTFSAELFAPPPPIGNGDRLYISHGKFDTQIKSSQFDE